MKLKTFNTINVASLSSKIQKPFIQVNAKTGLFNINNAACELMGLKDNDMIQFHQSEEEPSDWYLEQVKKDGFVIRNKENVGKGNLFNSTKICRMIFDSIAYEGKSGRIYIGEQITVNKQKLWTLITSSLVNI